MPSVVRTSSTTLRFSNSGKRARLSSFLLEYRRVCQCVLDHVWDNGICVGDRKFDLGKGLLYTPSFLPKSCMPDLDTPLSARAVKCASTQAMSMLGAAIKRRQKDLHWAGKLEGKESPAHLCRRLAQPLQKPSSANIKAELNSVCASIRWGASGLFDGWLVLSSLGKSYGKIELPLRRHRHMNRLSGKGVQMPSILISVKSVDIRFKIEAPDNNGTRVVGADSGLKTVLSLSDGQTTPTTDSHGHSLSSICHTVSRRKKGSRSFARAVAHRTNFVNWSVNQLDFSNVHEIRLEKITNINHRRRTSGYMRSWASTSIRDKVLRLAEDQNVSVLLQSSSYRSQRCSSCGSVRKANRKGKIYSCKRCGYVCDADVNAARNHEQALPRIPKTFLRTKRNLGEGFLWLPSGCYSLSGAELTVPPSPPKAVA